MIHIKALLWPFGRRTDDIPLGTCEIVNIGGSTRKGVYKVTFATTDDRKDIRLPTRAITVHVADFDRLERDVWELVREALLKVPVQGRPCDTNDYGDKPIK